MRGQLEIDEEVEEATGEHADNETRREEKEEKKRIGEDGGRGGLGIIMGSPMLRVLFPGLGRSPFDSEMRIQIYRKKSSFFAHNDPCWRTGVDGGLHCIPGCPVEVDQDKLILTLSHWSITKPPTPIFLLLFVPLPLLCPHLKLDIGALS